MDEPTSICCACACYTQPEGLTRRTPRSAFWQIQCFEAVPSPFSVLKSKSRRRKMSFCVCDNGSSLGYGKFVPSSRVKQPEYKLGRRLNGGLKPCNGCKAWHELA